ncbi:ABC transporter ATP-binding protein [Photobacterium sp. TY1-4]|uniref:ABC transporter ATP-binding protein n=1 Tax=Photobacterium sp. TY1-4 TaxID=2899122 RepID=UPI0021C0027F|nr:ABC transporter ATP-binding protein [Photobacterium sp. TY1-4]UXI04585.1 ABC transporter ATP-binding protein [Photobacterium sp. TY1-4]
MLSPAVGGHPPPVQVSLNHASLRYRDAATAVFDDLNLTLPAGQWTCLLGKSGCGKTTLLRHLAGLSGDAVLWQGQLLTSDEQPLQDRVAYMAQQDLLLPWLSVLDNVCLSQRLGSGATTPDATRAMSLLAAVGLADFHAVRPDQLSGGMRQRVALARTLMQDKPLVLMDEPFSALDAVTRHKLQSLAAELLQDRTVLLITHDPQEALRLAHHIYLMSGSPAQLARLAVPQSVPPRSFDAQMAAHQQMIIDQLERDYG